MKKVIALAHLHEYLSLTLQHTGGWGGGGQSKKKKIGNEIFKSFWTPPRISFPYPAIYWWWGSLKETSQELRMLSSVTIDCQITKIAMDSGSQLSELLSVSQ